MSPLSPGPGYSWPLSSGIVQMPPFNQALGGRGFLEKEAIPSTEGCNGSCLSQEASGFDLSNMICI